MNPRSQTTVRLRSAAALAAIIAMLAVVVFGLSRDEKTDAGYPQYRFPRGTLTAGTTTIAVFLAETPDATVRGLSGLPALDPKMGMFFLFDRADYHAFWMPDMRFPIDIVWIGEDWRIVDITPLVAPETYPELFRPKAPARYVLEINAGKALEWGLLVGDAVSLERDDN